MSLVPSSSSIETGGGYTLSRSLRFRKSASAYLSRTPASSTNRTTWTLSCWLKMGVIPPTELAGILSADTGSNNSIYYNTSAGVTWDFNGSTALVTTQVFRDPSAWYHFVFVADTTNATSSNRLRIYVNGAQITAFSTASYPAQNAVGGVNSNTLHAIGRSAFTTTRLFDGYMAEVNFIDGQALTPSSFGQTDATTGVWVPKKYTGTYGTNGFYLPFTNTTSATTLAYDSSGNGNNWTPNNISTTAGVTYDSMTDVPTLTSATAGNFATLNPLDKYSSLSMTNGNLTITNDGGSGSWWTTRSTIWISSGKWYWESTIGGSQYSVVGVAGLTQPVFTNDRWVGYTSDSYGYYGANGNKVNANSSTAYGSSYTAGDVIGVALDMDAGTLVFYKNGVSQGTAFTGLSGLVSPGFSVNDQGTNPYQDVNFGQRPFTYTTAGSNRPASTFLALNTFNLSAPTIPAGNKYMDATLYTGNGSTQSIVNAAGFQPNLVWNKDRSNASSHALFDSVRGVTKELYPNTTDAEATVSGVTSFNSNGYTVGSNTRSNANGSNFVGWQWKESTTAGFDIVTYSGDGSASRTISHNLGIAPAFMIVKNRTTGANNWAIYHKSLGNTLVTFFTTATPSLSSGTWNNTSPTASDFTVGSQSTVNSGSDNYVAYLFAEISGFSAFGKYTGNGSANGPFVYCGFRPKFIMYKNASTAGYSWIMCDSARIGYNDRNDELFANSNSAEVSSSGNQPMDFLSNGFKVRNLTPNQNDNGSTYIYAAFAENPFKYANAR